MNATTQRNLVLLPGLDGTGLLFRDFVAALPGTIRPHVVAYPADRPLSLEAHAAEVAEALPTGDVAVLAESFSGLVVLALLAEQPRRVETVLFVNSFAEPPRPLLLALARWLPRAGVLMRSAPAWLFRALCLGHDADAWQVAMMREALAAVRPAILPHRLRLIADRHTFTGGPFEIPCHYLQARGDRLVPRAAAQWFRRHFNPCQVTSMDGPHFLLQARPAACAEWVARTLGTP